MCSFKNLMSKKQYFSKTAKRGIIKHVYEEGRERTIHIKKRHRIPANKKTQRIEPAAAISESKKPSPARRPLHLDNYELPAYYGTTRLVLIVKDPFWLYAYWEISPGSLESLKRILIEEQIQKAKTVLRMYDVTLVDFNGMNANSYFDIDVGNNTGNWYISLWRDNVSYIGEIGLKTDSGDFYSLARSNCVHTPRASYSPRTEQILMKLEDNKPIFTYVFTQLNIPQARRRRPQRYPTHLNKKRRVFYIAEDEIRRYYSNLSIPLRDIISRRFSRLHSGKFAMHGFLLEGEGEKLKILSRFPKEYFLKKLLLGASEEVMLLGSSEHFAGGASGLVQEKIRQQSFFFEVQAELIVYGRTEPNAKLELGGKEIKLRNDGTFSLRFALPDGKIPLGFKATSYDKSQVKRINTYVGRKTHYSGDQK